MRLTLRNGGSDGTGRLWCRYVVARAVAMLVDIVKEGVVKPFSVSIIVQDSEQMQKTTKRLALLCQVPQSEGAWSGPR